MAEEEKLKPLKKGYDAESDQAKIGKDGEDRLFVLLYSELVEVGGKSPILVERGLKNPSANGRLGDILFRRNKVDAPICGVEVKTSTAKHPDSVCLSRFEHSQSTADWLACGNEDEAAGWWFTTMAEAKRAGIFKRAPDGGFHVVRRGDVKTMTDAELVEEIRRKFV